MIAPPSFLAALDMPQPKPAKGEAEAPEGTENSGNDGFAALIAQLMQILPTASGPKVEAAVPAEDGAGNLPAGKILPADGGNLAAASAGQIVGEAGAGPVSLPVAAGSLRSSATFISFQRAQTALAAQQSVPIAIAPGATASDGSQAPTKDGAAAVSAGSAPRADQIRMTVSVAPIEPASLRAAAPLDASVPVEKQLSASLGSVSKTAVESVPTSVQPRRASIEGRSPHSVESVPTSAQPRLTSIEGRAPHSVEPVPTSVQPRLASIEGRAPHSVESVPTSAQPRLTSIEGRAPHSVEPVPTSVQPRLASLEGRAPHSNGPMAATFAAEPKQAGREAQAPAAISSERAQPVRTSSLEKDASSGDRSGQAAGAESPTGAARTLASSEGAKPFAMPAIAPIEAAAVSRSDGMRISAPTTASAMTSVEGIERLVERLSVAREFDLTKSASIAVTHREFGALTVTFDNARSGLDVEIAAKDNDMQRALALAVAADRPAGRAGEPLQQSLAQTSQMPSTASERGAGTAGQGANSAGANSSDSGTQGDRSQNQRDRHLASLQPDPRNSARASPGDDALYA